MTFAPNHIHNFDHVQNPSFLQACMRQASDHTPVWLMRQAGRYLPEYRETRAKAGSFMGLATNTDYATEVTLQPLARYKLDAAILFSDILTIPDAMGLGLYFAEGEGPKFERPLHDEAAIAATKHWVQERHYNAEWALSAQLEVLARQFDDLEQHFADALGVSAPGLVVAPGGLRAQGGHRAAQVWILEVFAAQIESGGALQPGRGNAALAGKGQHLRLGLGFVQALAGAQGQHQVLQAAPGRQQATAGKHHAHAVAQAQQPLG